MWMEEVFQDVYKNNSKTKLQTYNFRPWVVDISIKENNLDYKFFNT